MQFPHLWCYTLTTAGNQCSCFSAGVTWSRRPIFSTRPAATFCTRCNGSMEVHGTTTSSLPPLLLLLRIIITSSSSRLVVTVIVIRCCLPNVNVQWLQNYKQLITVNLYSAFFVKEPQTLSLLDTRADVPEATQSICIELRNSCSSTRLRNITARDAVLGYWPALASSLSVLDCSARLTAGCACRHSSLANS